MKAPISEFSDKFIELMNNRMHQSYYKYGPIKKAYPFKVDAIKSLKVAIDKYQATGNTEYLVDAANYAMIEFMLPSRSDAYFESTDSGGSAGRVWCKGGRPNQKDNDAD